YDGDIDHVRPAAGDIDYLLEATNSFFGTSLGPQDLTGAYAGVRPLISSGDARRSVDISRKAELYETSSGLITITGGKLTTWRRRPFRVIPTCSPRLRSRRRGSRRAPSATCCCGGRGSAWWPRLRSASQTAMCRCGWLAR